MIVYKSRLLKKYSNRKSKLVLSRLVTTWLSNNNKYCISFGTNLAANFGCNRFRNSPHHFQGIQAFLCRHLKSLCCSIRIWADALLLESRTGRRFRSAALHRIPFGTWGFVHKSYFYSKTNDWAKDWVKRWVQLCSATASRQFHRKFHFIWKRKILIVAWYLQSIKTFLILELGQYRRSGGTFSWNFKFLKRACRCP